MVADQLLLDALLQEWVETARARTAGRRLTVGAALLRVGARMGLSKADLDGLALERTGCDAAALRERARESEDRELAALEDQVRELG